VLLLSGSLGGGHDALAAGCTAAFRSAGLTAETIDVMDSLGQGPGAVAHGLFRYLFGMTAVYDAFHFSQLRDGSRLAAAAERAAVDRASPAVIRHLGAGGIDLVLSVFATGAGVASRLKAAGRCRSSVVFIPDSCAHRMWVHDNTDLFLVTSRLGAASVRRYRPDAPVRVIPAPLRPAFLSPSSREGGRLSLGIPSDASCLLLVGGAWGLGPIVDLSAALVEDGHHVIAVAGSNQMLLAKLRARARLLPGLHPVGFTDRMSELMAASDLVVTTAGITCREARAVGRGLVLLDVVPGHGRENLAHELEQGQAAVTQAEPRSLVRTVSICLGDAEFSKESAGEDPDRASRSFLAAVADLGIPLGT
jgi:UDP-N-acetylglucosamine:LPS N-acetylglucosamine transferase